MTDVPQAPSPPASARALRLMKRNMQSRKEISGEESSPLASEHETPQRLERGHRLMERTQWRKSRTGLARRHGRYRVRAAEPALGP